LAESKYGVDYLTLITGRKKKDEILRLLLDSGCHLIDIVYAKGSVKTGYFKDMLGLMPEEKKVMITCLVAGNLTDKIFERLVNDFDFNEPNTGIAFVVPLDRLLV